MSSAEPSSELGRGRVNWGVMIGMCSARFVVGAW